MAVAAAMTMAGVACVDLKAPANDDPAVARPDASSLTEDGAAPGVDPTASALASGRKRLSDLPRSWFASGSNVYLVNDTLQRVRPSTGDSLAYTFPIDKVNPKLAAASSLIIVQSASGVVIYDASMPSTAVYTHPNAAISVVGLAKSVGWTESSASPPGRSLYVYDQQADAVPELATSILEVNVEIVGTRTTEVFLHAPGSLDLVSARAKPSRILKWVLPSADLLRVDGATGSTTDLIAVFGTAESPRFEQLNEEGLRRDLNAEIDDAPSSVPRAMRAPTGSAFAQSGNWFVYGTVGGLLAYDRVAKRLVPCQLPLSSGVTLRSPAMVEGDILVFELAGGDESREGKPGLYAVKLPLSL